MKLTSKIMRRAWAVAWEMARKTGTGVKQWQGYGMSVAIHAAKESALKSIGAVSCERCGSNRTAKNGTNKAGSQKYICRSCGKYGTKTRSEAAKLAA